MEEVWKEIKGFDNYRVSNLSRVISIKRVTMRKNKYPLSVPERELTQFKNFSGSNVVYLTKEGARYTKQVHLLVKEYFGAV